MTDLAVIVPVLARPHRAAPLADSLHHAATLTVRLVFVCSPDDHDEIAACKATGADVLVVDWRPGHGDWARKINHAIAHTSEELLLLGADDLEFHHGFDVAMAARTDDGYGVVGARDLGNPTVDAGRHSCHPLVTRDYVRLGAIDDPSRLLHEGYRHNFVDTELVETAKARHQFGFAPAAIVEHLHPLWSKADMDQTYELGRAGYMEDRRLFTVRRRLWATVPARTAAA